jgi:hypothetical protein
MLMDMIMADGDEEPMTARGLVNALCVVVARQPDVPAVALLVWGWMVARGLDVQDEAVREAAYDEVMGQVAEIRQAS